MKAGSVPVWGRATLRAALVEAGLLRNLKIADGLGLLTLENRQRLKRGAAPIVTRGHYAGQPAEVDHFAPLTLATEVDHELANLELLPATLNRQKSTRVSERQMDYARRFQAAECCGQAPSSGSNIYPLRASA